MATVGASLGPARRLSLGRAPLTAPALGAWGSAAVGTVVAPATEIRVAEVAAGLALTALLLGRLAALGRALTWTAAGTLVAIVVAALATSRHTAALRAGPIPGLAERSASVYAHAVLVRDPQPITTRTGEAMTLVDATVTSVWSGRWLRVHTPVLVLSRAPGWTGLLPGQRVELTGRLSPARGGDDVAAVLDARAPPYPLGRPPWWQRAAGSVRASFLAVTSGLPAGERGLVPGLVDGDTTRIPASQQAALRVSGLTHLDAVSGENVSVVLAVVIALARAAGVRRVARVTLCAAALVAFVVLARPSPSVLRAAVMGVVVLVGMLTGRRTSTLAALSAAVLGLVVVDPFLATTLGFALSVVATAALAGVAPSWSRRLSRYLPEWLACAVAVSAAAQLACTPLLVGAFGQLTPYAVPANLAAAPAVGPATILGLSCAVTAVALPGLGVALAWLAAVPAAVIAGVAALTARLPGAAVTWPGPTWMVWAGAALLAVVALRGSRSGPPAEKPPVRS